MKEPKVYYMGKRVRDNEGRFSSFKIKAKNFLRKVFQLSILGLALYVAFISGRYIQPNESIINVIEAQDTLAGKIEGLKNEVVETVKECESRNNKNLIYTFDPDPRQPGKQVASFGMYQYKLKTIVDYTKILKGETITERQALDIALDEQKAGELTKEIIFKDTGKGVKNWWHCSNKHDLSQKIAIIKSLEQ